MRKIILIFCCSISFLPGLSQVVDRTPYCASGATSNSTERINAFSMKEIVYTNTTTCTTSNNLTAKAVSMAPGELINASITLGACGGTMSSSAFKVFVDWNADGDFSDINETVFTADVATNITKVYPISFTVPEKVKIGQVTMMRIVNQSGVTPSAIQPCGTFSRGETQDYTVQISLFNGPVSIAALTGNITNLKAGDFDNDGDLDLIVKEATTPAVRLFRNTTTIPGNLSLTNTGFSFPSNIEIDGWLDFNNDGFLDLMTHTSGGPASVYQSNNGTSFTALPMSFGDVAQVDWADYDKDGDLDFLVRAVSFNGTPRLYKQEADRTFVLASGPAKGYYFFDFDNDTDFDASDGRYIYTNVNGNFEETHNFFPSNEAMNVSRPAYTDFDLDGDLDIVVIWNRVELGGITLEFLKNTNGVFTRTTIPNDFIPANFIEPYDFDNNGKPDLIVTEGYNPGSKLYSIYELNESGNMAIKYKVPAHNTITYFPRVAETGDFDKDGNVDFITAINDGSSYYAYFLKNRATSSNQVPSVPANLTATVESNTVKLKWDASNDDHTLPNSLFYNMTLRRGADTIKSSFSRKSGSRKVHKKGNMTLSEEFNLASANLPQGLYSWAVQAIDQSQSASAFAPEGTFELVSENYQLTKLANTSDFKSLFNPVRKEYVISYIQSGNIYYQRLDARGQSLSTPVKINLITTGCTKYELVPGLDDNEYFIVWTATQGLYARRILEVNPTNEMLVEPVTAPTYQGLSAAYNSTARTYTVFYSSYTYDVVTNNFVSNLRAVGLTPTGSSALTTSPAKLISNYVSVGYYQIQFEISTSFNSAYNCYLLAWDESRPASDFDLSQVLFPASIKLQLVSPTLNPYGTPLSTTVDLVTNLSLKAHFQNAYMSIWTEYDQFPTTGSGSNSYDYVYETQGALLKITGSPSAPTLTRTPLPFPLSKATTQGTLYTGTGGPSFDFNSRRNEFMMIWRNNPSGGYLKQQRYDVVDNKLVLPDELRINDYKGDKTKITFNSERNEFIISWVEGTNVFYTQIKTPKDNVPMVTSIDKPKAYPGEKVVITGDFFGKTYFLDKVKFGTLDAAITSAYSDGKHIEVIVPEGLGRTPVPVSVIYDDQTGVSSFFFETLSLHSITAIDKTEGEPGTLVTITGTKFAEDPSELVIRFGDVLAAAEDIISNSATEIKVKVPVNAVRGTKPLSVTIQGQVVNAPTDFRVIIAPEITSVDALEGFITCKTVTIKGIHFTTDVSQLVVKFGDVVVPAVDFVAATETALIVRVPVGADGNVPISVTTDDRTSTSEPASVSLGSTISSVKLPGKIELTNRSTDAIDMQVKVLNQCSVDEVKLFRKGISTNNTTWTSEILTGMEDNRIDLEIGETSFKNDPIGLNFFYEVKDKSGKLVRSDTFNVYKQFTEFDSTNFVPSLVFGGNTNNYNLVSLPYEMTPNKVTTVFKDVFNKYGYDTTQWRIFHYQNKGVAPRKYVEYLRGLDAIEVGKSYWIIVRRQVDIFFEGAQSVDLSTGPFKLIIQPGWNQIGNPYNFNVSWPDVLAFNNNPVELEPLKTYANGTFGSGTVLNRFSGAFVHNTGTVAIELAVPFLKNSSVNPGGRERGNPGQDIGNDAWELPISLEGKTIINTLGRIGMNPESTDGVDYYDEHALPRFYQNLDMKFPDNLIASISHTAESFTWEFTVDNNTPDDVLSLQWNNDLGENDKELFLYSVDEEKIINMRDQSRYTFSFSKGRRFRIFFGNADDLSEKISPERSTLGEPFPNPFSNAARIPFTVAHERENVRLSVLNMQGQEVSVLLNQDMVRGFYAADLMSDELPGGIYLVKMQVLGNYPVTLTKKIVVVK